MKCEICHKRDAETALATAEGDEDNELYVCLECAKAERLKHQKKSQRTRKIVEINGQVVDGDEVPPFIGAIMGAFDDMVNEIEKASGGESGEAARKRRATNRRSSAPSRASNFRSVAFPPSTASVRCSISKAST